MGDKIFSELDHAMILILVERVLPHVDTKKRIKWVRDIISSYHNWHGFFKNEKIHKNIIHNHHNYLSKVVTKKKQLIDNCHEYVKSRERKSSDLKIIMYKCGLNESKLINDMSWVIHNKDSLKKIFFKTDLKSMIHFYFVLGFGFSSIFSGENVPSYLFYEFVDIAEKIISTQNENEKSENIHISFNCNGICTRC